MTKQTPTPGAGDAFRDAVLDAYDLGADSLAVLDQVASTLDTIAALDVAIAQHGVVSKTAAGAVIPSPLVTERRQQQLSLRALLGTLALPDPETPEPSHEAQRRSRKARDAANARWTRNPA